jgi:hypothetical protein
MLCLASMLAKHVRPVTGAPLHDSVSYPVGHCPVRGLLARPTRQPGWPACTGSPWPTRWTAGPCRRWCSTPPAVRRDLCVGSEGQDAPWPWAASCCDFHGNTGSPMALHDLANGLARQGFVVVAVIHPGDNSRDRAASGRSATSMVGRCRSARRLPAARRQHWFAIRTTAKSG